MLAALLGTLLGGALPSSESSHQRSLLAAAAGTLKAKAEEVPERIAGLQAQLKEAKKAQKQAASADLAGEFEKLRGELQTVSGVSVGILDRPDLSGGDLRDLAERLKASCPDLAAAVFGREAGKVPFVILSQGKAREAGIGAGDLARELKGVLGGGGGGRPEQAQGQGADADAVPRAVETLSSRIQEALA